MTDGRRHYKWIALVLAMLGAASLACGLGVPTFSGFGLHGTFTLRPGEQRSGDQMVIANNVNLTAGSTIDGDLTAVANHIAMDGAVTGDLVTIANEFVLGETASVGGDVVLCANTFVQREGARIGGELRRECSEGERATVAGVLGSGVDGWRAQPVFRLGGLIGGALLSGGLAALMAAIFPQRMARMAASLRRSPWATGSVGCLTFIIVIGLTVVYAVSLVLVLPVLLLPFVILGWVVLGLVALAGWSALATLLGRSIARRVGLGDQAPLVAAAIGGVSLALLANVWGIFWFTGWIGTLISIVAGSLALGVVVLTRLGNQFYPRSVR